MTANDLLRSTSNALPGEQRLKGFLDIVRFVMVRIRDHGATLGGWSFDFSKSELDMIATYDTGTISVTNGNATITGTGTTFTSAMVGRKIRIAGVAYTLSTFASTTSMDLTTVYGGTTDTSTKFTIYQDEYALTAGLTMVHRMWDLTNQNLLIARSRLRVMDLDTAGNSTGAPQEAGFGGASGTVREYGVVGRNSSDVFIIKVFPYPTAIARLEYWYQANYVQVSDIGDSVVIPEYFDELVKQGCLARAKQQLHMDDWREEMIIFGEMLREAKFSDTPLRDTVVRAMRTDRYGNHDFRFSTARVITANP